MNENGLDKNKVLDLLGKKLDEDASFKSGRILGSMCSEPHEISKKIFSLTFQRNLGDQFVFPSISKIEHDAISTIGNMLSNDGAVGHIVSGGTEANITALWVARKLKEGHKKEVILSESAHFSFERASDILGLKLVKIPLTRDFTIDVSKVRESINKNTLAIVGVAGSTGFGTVDPIQVLSDISLKNDLYLHVDAAFGGFILPFLKELGLYNSQFDFAVPGVNSITIDPHKMGLAPIPAGCILFRESSLLSKISLTASYIGRGGQNFTTMSCTRPSTSTVAVWAIMKTMGKSGYRSMVKRCMDNTLMLANDIRCLQGVKLMLEPTMNIVSFTCSQLSNKILFEKLERKGWVLSIFPTHLRVVIMPHVKKKHLKAFVSDLSEVFENSL